jgi:hypothetical protein
LKTAAADDPAARGKQLNKQQRTVMHYAWRFFFAIP